MTFKINKKELLELQRRYLETFDKSEIDVTRKEFEDLQKELESLKREIKQLKSKQ